MSKRPSQNHLTITKGKPSANPPSLSKKKPNSGPGNYFKGTSFLKSAHHPSQYPLDDGKEVAFIGRSNVGKSTVINTLTHLGKLARTSKTPGRTQLFNFFEIAPFRRLVDIPGMGFAKVALSLRAHWQNTLQHYLSERQSLSGIILVMDCRHPLQPIEEDILSHISMGTPTLILLNKADKFTARDAKQVLNDVNSQVATYSAPIQVQLFSGITRLGAPEASRTIEGWLSTR